MRPLSPRLIPFLQETLHLPAQQAEKPHQEQEHGNPLPSPVKRQAEKNQISDLPQEGIKYKRDEEVGRQQDFV